MAEDTLPESNKTVSSPDQMKIEGNQSERGFTAPMSMEELFQVYSDNGGSSTSVQNALQQVAFRLCVDVISQDIAKSTLRLHKRLKGNKTSEIVEPDKHPIARLLALDPNRRHTWEEYTEMSVAWDAMEMNSYSYVVRDRFGEPLEIIPVQPGRVRERIFGRETFYTITASTMQEQALLGFSTREVPERDMIHVRGRMLDGFSGYSTMAAGRTTLESGEKITQYRDQVYGEDGQLRGVFTKEGDEFLTEPNFQRLREQFRVLMNRYRSLTEPIILEGGISFEKTSSNPQEMEFAKQLAFQVADMARLMRVPPHKLFLMDGSKYDNLDTSEKIYVGDTLVPYCRRREQRYSRVLLSEEDRLKYFFEYDREEMTLRDSARETDRIYRLASLGILLTDEARAAIGRNPLPNKQGQTRLIPSNTTLIDLDGNVVVAGSSAAATESDTTESEAEVPTEETEAEPEKTASLRLIKGSNHA